MAGPSIGDAFGALVDQHRNGDLGQGPLDNVLRQIRDDAWNREGPGEYVLPDVRTVQVRDGSGIDLPILYVNRREVGSLHRGTDMMARALLPGYDITIRGHYQNTRFYIDQIEQEELFRPKTAPASTAPASTSPLPTDSFDHLDASQCDDMAMQLLARARALRSEQAAATAPAATPEPAPAPAPASPRIERTDTELHLGNIAIPIRQG